MHIHIRHIILYHFEKSWNTAHLYRDFSEHFSEGTITKSQVKRWFKKSKLDKTKLVDEGP